VGRGLGVLALPISAPTRPSVIVLPRLEVASGPERFDLFRHDIVDVVQPVDLTHQARERTEQPR